MLDYDLFAEEYNAVVRNGGIRKVYDYIIEQLKMEMDIFGKTVCDLGSGRIRTEEIALMEAKMAEEELFKIFDTNRNVIGTAMRKDVHRMGYWHETFHCWLISRENNKVYIYLQIRSDTKKEFPNLLDITAAGHLLAHETVYDGVREIKEEIGIDVSFDELVPAGLIKYSMAREQLLDNEFAHVFLYETKFAIDEYILQKEEVSGIVRAEFSDFCKLWCGEIDEVVVEGMENNKEGQRVQVKKTVNKTNFVPHNNTYYQKIVQAVYDLLE